MHRLLKALILLFIICFLPALVFSQSLLSFNGLVFNQKNSSRLGIVTITNLKHNAIAYSNEIGYFSIKAAIGDTLLFTRNGFTDQKIGITQQMELAVFMIPVLQLSDVIIKGETKKQQQKEALDMYRSKGVFYNGKPPVLAAIASPLTGLYELFGKTPGQARRFNKFVKTENQQIEISRRYNKELVKRITKLSDEEVEKFIYAYTPQYDDLKKWNDYELIQYINKSLVNFKNEKNLPPLQKLY
jgi:hypothetical protein